MRDSVHESIESAFNKSASLKFVRGQIGILCNELFAVPTGQQQWAMAEVEAVYSSLPINVPPVPPHDSDVSSEPPIPSLFSREVLYHAGLCCQVVSTCTAATFQASLDKVGSGHLLEEASMSISQDRDNVDRYMIAKQDDKIYITFQSEPFIKTWICEHTSFDEGIVQVH